MSNLLTQRRIFRPFDPSRVRTLEQWFVADRNVAVSSGVVDSILSINLRYLLTASGGERPTYAVDADGFTYLGFNGSTQRFALPSSLIKDFGIEPSGVEWHGVLSFNSSVQKYLMVTDPAIGESRPAARLYRPGATQMIAFPEPGGSGGATLNASTGAYKSVVSVYRSPTGTTLAVGVNGVFVVDTAASAATTFGRGAFNWWYPYSAFTNANVYEGMGFVATLSDAERQSVISYLRNKYRI